MFWFKKKDKIALDAAVRAAGKAATVLVVEKAAPEAHVFPATAAHFGGNPYFETGDTWPTVAEDGRPYDFVRQVNLKDCPERPDTPLDLFTVFLCWALLEEVDVERVCIVRTYRDASAAKAVPRCTVALRYRVLDNEPAFMVIDPDGRPSATSELVGRALARSQVVGEPIAAQAFAIADAV